MAQPPGAAALSADLAPSRIQARDDFKDDSGQNAIVRWKPPQAPPPAGQELVGFRIYQSAVGKPFVGLLDLMGPEAKSMFPAPPPPGKVIDGGLWHAFFVVAFAWSRVESLPPAARAKEMADAAAVGLEPAPYSTVTAAIGPLPPTLPRDQQQACDAAGLALFDGIVKALHATPKPTWDTAVGMAEEAKPREAGWVTVVQRLFEELTARGPASVRDPLANSLPADPAPLRKGLLKNLAAWADVATAPAKEAGDYRKTMAEYEGDLLDPAPTCDGVVQKLWTWRAYQFKVAALYAPKDRVWYVRGGVKPKAPTAPKPGEPTGPVVEAQEAPSTDVSPAMHTEGRWYFTERTNALVGTLLFSLIVIWYISHARRGKELYIRPIAGIEAVDDAIGRATEMGKPILFVPGLAPLGDIATITAMTILGRVARRTAEYETPLLVPNIDPLVMLAAREIVREAYIDAGKPDAYREQDITYTTGTQFAYVAAVDGIMMRERPAANFYMGAFAAEALILAETGAQTGAIQIAGTDADTQIPFFVTACDFCLMGEELYAATAYLSREPLLLAQLKAQDVGKVFIAAMIALGAVGASAAAFLAATPSGQAASEVILKCIGWLKGG